MKGKDFLNGFFKVANSGSSFVTVLFFNPETKESLSIKVDDIDYCATAWQAYDQRFTREEADEIWRMPVNEEALKKWQHHKGVILKGDEIEVVRGRKVPKGTKGTVTGFSNYKDRYGRIQTEYVHFVGFENNQYKTNVNNCVLVEV